MATETPVRTSSTEALARVEALVDLSNVRAKLADPEEGKGYDVGRLDLMEAEYRKFLALQLLHPDTDIVPCKLADEIWHQHILDTVAYRRDCEALFGQFLDHFPYFGMRGPDDAEALEDAYAATVELYTDAFGPPPDDVWIAADAARCRKPTCRRREG
jgi:hypothetical protein